MLIRLISNSFRRQKRRRAIAFVAVVVGTAAATALANVALDVGDKVTRELRSFGANLVVLPAGGSLRVLLAGEDLTAHRARAFLSAADVLKVKENFWKNNILSFAPWLDVPARGGGRELVVRGSWFARQIVLSDGRTLTTGLRDLYPYWKIRGVWPVERLADPQPASALVGRALARELRLAPGSALVVEGAAGRRELSISGILETGGEEEELVVVPLERAQELGGLQGKIDGVFVSALTTPESAVYERLGKNPAQLPPAQFESWSCTPFVSSIAYEIGNALPGAEARPIRRIADSEGKVLGRIGGLMAMMAAMAGIGAALTVTSALMSGVLERRAEIGLLKSLGAGDAGVVGLFLAEAAVLGVAGGLAGGVLGVALSRAIAESVFGSPGSVKLLSIPIAITAALFITLAGCVLPARRIAGFRPVEALKG